MTKSSQTRIGKKKKPAGHAQSSFDDLVAKAAVKHVHPLVGKVVDERLNFAMSQISQNFVSMIKDLQTKIISIQNTLVTKGVIKLEDVDEAGWKLEDEAWNLVESVGKIEQFDLIRLNIFTKEEGSEDDFQGPFPYRINSVMRVVDEKVQSFKELEEDLIGKKVGDSGEVVVISQDEKGESIKSIIQYTILRVSENVQLKQAQIKAKEAKEKAEKEKTVEGAKDE